MTGSARPACREPRPSRSTPPSSPRHRPPRPRCEAPTWSTSPPSCAATCSVGCTRSARRSPRSPPGRDRSRNCCDGPHPRCTTSSPTGPAWCPGPGCTRVARARHVTRPCAHRSRRCTPASSTTRSSSSPPCCAAVRASGCSPDGSRCSAAVGRPPRSSSAEPLARSDPAVSRRSCSAVDAGVVPGRAVRRPVALLVLLARSARAVGVATGPCERVVGVARRHRTGDLGLAVLCGTGVGEVLRRLGRLETLGGDPGSVLLLGGRGALDLVDGLFLLDLDLQVEQEADRLLLDAVHHRGEHVEAFALVFDQRVALRVGTQVDRSEEHTSEPQSLMRISYAVLCVKKKKKNTK